MNLRAFSIVAGVGAATAALVAWLGSTLVGGIAGVAILLVAVVVSFLPPSSSDRPHDPDRRLLLAGASVIGVASVIGAASLGRIVRSSSRPHPTNAQARAAERLGAEYMELIDRAIMPGRSGDLQLVLAPFNSANYAPESTSLTPRDPRTSHASVWMYLQRIPLVIYGPGVIAPGDSVERVTLADLAPTTARLVGMSTWPDGRDGRPLGPRPLQRPRIVVTVVIDGGGWNTLSRFPDRWPNLRRMMRGGANHRDAIVGSFPAVTACAHATIGTGAFPWKHGITGHNIRSGDAVRKAYGIAGHADPDDILLPTLADLWSAETAGRAWIGEIGYQVWHLGMIGAGGVPADGRPPVGVYWNDVTEAWEPHHPTRYRLPNAVPDPEILAGYRARFVPPFADERALSERQALCCRPPIVTFQGDLIEETLRSEALGVDETALLYTTFKAPDYTGHTYGLASPWVGLALESVDDQLGRLEASLERHFPGEYVLIVTADHGQCPLPDDSGGVRLDPIQLQARLDQEFGGLLGTVQSVVPSEVYLDARGLWESGATVNDVATTLAGLTYRQNIGPYVPRDAIQQDLLDRPEFTAVFSAGWLLSERAGGAHRGPTVFGGEDIDPGLPPIP